MVWFEAWRTTRDANFQVKNFWQPNLRLFKGLLLFIYQFTWHNIIPQTRVIDLRPSKFIALHNDDKVMYHTNYPS